MGLKPKRIKDLLWDESGKEIGDCVVPVYFCVSSLFIIHSTVILLRSFSTPGQQKQKFVLVVDPEQTCQLF